ncbi:MAG: asparagine synthase-related protein [Pseudonocardia sp.]
MTATTQDVWYRMTPLELASGTVRGIDATVAPLPTAPAGLTTRAALEDVMLRVLQRPPCIVSFSGGRDSSAVLALATHVARREGLPLPVPVSVRFRSCASADEDSWQELVIGHLGIADWIHLVFDDELDNIGPYSRAVMERHGLLWPSNAHFHLPIVEQAPGGTLLTGFGGDEMLETPMLWRRVNQVLARQIPLACRDLPRLAVAYGPAPMRRAALRRRLGDVAPLPWLRPGARRQLATAIIRDIAAEPVRWDASTDIGWWRRRYRRVVETSLQCVADVHGVAVSHPLADEMVLAAMAREGGRTGFTDRSAAMEHVVGDLLPERLTARPSKAVLTGVFWNRYSTEFAGRWDGAGVDPDIVDVDFLRQMWTAADRPPDGRTSSLLRSAWLASRSGPDAATAS